MKKRDIKVGMRVRIKSWEDMLKGVGVKIEDNGIKFPQTDIIFNFEMKKYCGKTAIVEKIDERIKLDFGDNVIGTPYLWSYIPQMLEPVEEENVNEEVRYFELVSKTAIGKKGDIGQLIHEERVRENGQPYLLYNEKWDGHSGNGFYEVDKEYEDHCWWFMENEVKEIKKSKPIETKESRIESVVKNGETIGEEKPKKQSFTKENLKFGNVVELRGDNALCLLIPHSGENNSVGGTISNITIFASLPKGVRVMYGEDINDDLTSNWRNHYDIMKVYEDYTMKNLLWERKEIKLSEDERIILKNIDKKYKWIAREKSGQLWLFEDRPTISDDYWFDNGVCVESFYYFDNLFQFVKWENQIPYNIEELLSYES